VSEQAPGDETALGRRSNERLSKARLRDGLVLRDPGPWTPAVIALLRYLEKVGFTAAPRVVGNGTSEDGRELLTFIPGESPHPRAWGHDAAGEVGEILAALHRATASFRSPPGARWHSSFVDLTGDDIVIGHVIGHGDAGPWNWIAQDGHPVALIDWEFAGPVDRLWELAEVVWLNAQLHDDDVAERNGLPPMTERARLAREVLDGYELESRRRNGFVDRMIEFAVQSARAEAVDYGVQPDTTNGISDSGFPFVWGITWRIRSAAWMLSNRRELVAIIERVV
jgi:hypothetical protein